MGGRCARSAWNELLCGNVTPLSRADALERRVAGDYYSLTYVVMVAGIPWFNPIYHLETAYMLMFQLAKSFDRATIAADAIHRGGPCLRVELQVDNDRLVGVVPHVARLLRQTFRARAEMRCRSKNSRHTWV